MKGLLAHRRAYSAGSKEKGLSVSTFTACHWAQLTRWKNVSAILGIEPTAVDLADILSDIPGGVVGPD